MTPDLEAMIGQAMIGLARSEGHAPREIRATGHNANTGRDRKATMMAKVLDVFGDDELTTMQVSERAGIHLNTARATINNLCAKELLESVKKNATPAIYRKVTT